jgi:hypothetical protein
MQTRFVFFGLIALCVSACGGVQVQFGRDINLVTFKDQIQRGVTSRQNIEQWLGVPQGEGLAIEADGTIFHEWTYYYGNGNLSAMQNSRFKMLQIKFDDQGIVRAYRFSDQNS